MSNKNNLVRIYINLFRQVYFIIIILVNPVVCTSSYAQYICLLKYNHIQNETVHKYLCLKM